jgi:hypothetical protein
MIKQRAGTLFGLGLILGLVWTAAVTLSSPNWFDPSEACRHKFPGADGDVDIRTRFFPPSATCDFGGDVRQFMSPTTSAILSVTGVLILAVIVTGFVLTVRRLSGDPGPTRTAGDLNLTRRKLNHLAFGALDLGVAAAVLTFLNAFALVFGAIAGAVLFIMAAIAGLSALATLLDRHVGPLPSTALDNRRRGTVAGAGVFAVIFAATAVTGQLPFFRLWSVPLAALAYAVIVAVQWSRTPNKAGQARCSG